MLRRKLQGLEFLVESPSIYRAAVCPAISVIYNGYDWFLTIGVCRTFKHHARDHAIEQLVLFCEAVGAGADPRRLINGA